ncbi:MAG: hypothetical protein KBS55_01065 [Bacteroidales bacterium]|nr:hypothetical protein [Candidatus Cryptobacteroides aphodequi]
MAKKQIYRKLWKRSEDGQYRPERSFVRTAIVAGSLFLIFLLFKKDNLIQWAGAGLTIHRQNIELREGEKTLKRMDERIYDLTHNRDSLEKYARERYRFTRSGDDLFLVK